MYNLPTKYLMISFVNQSDRHLKCNAKLTKGCFHGLDKKKMKNLKSLKSQNDEPVCLCVTGDGGSRKSDLIKRIYHTVVKTYRHAPINPEKPTALLAASDWSSSSSH